MADSPTYRRATVVAVILLLTIAPARLSAQQTGAGDEPITRTEFAAFLEEYRQFKAEVGKLQEENDRLRQELAELKGGVAAPREVDWGAQFERRVAQERETILERVRDEFGPTLGALAPGLTNFTLGGAAVVTFQDRENVDSTFGIGIAPVLLWRPTDRLLLEAEVAFGLTADDTFVELDYAQFSYILNDYVTVGAGKFLTPFGTFWERWHPSWINKVATIPLIYERGLVGPTGLGIQLRGGFPVGRTKLNYAVYYVNGPDFEDTSLASAGHLGFENFRDNNNSKSYGGRVGFLPIPELELGYSFLTGRVGDSGSVFSGIDTFIHGVDFSYAQEFDEIKGRLDLRAEAIWVDTDRALFIGPFDPFTFDNKRNGWFVQAAYRPTKVDLKLGADIEVRNMEFVLRYDQLRESGPGDLGADQDRLTLGFDYWIRPNIVVKTAYVFDDSHGGEDQNGLFLQMAVGF